MTPRLWLPVLLCPVSVFLPAARAADWVHWRGPEQTGQSREANLPGDFDPSRKEKGNVVWKQPFGGRSSPLVMNGKLYIIQGVGEGVHEGEQVVCFDEKTGSKLWEYRVNVFHTDIVSTRLGWTTLTADPEAGYVYAHTTGGHLLCLDAAGKLVWSRQLTEEFGRVTGYGGRIVSPIFDSGLVIVGMPNGSWGDQARGLSRMVAFDGKTGQVVWWATLNPDALYGTYYSSPVVAVINGQRLLITGGADGGLHALKVRTGELVWSYPFARGIINGSPVVSGNLVYCTHGETNPEGAPVGRVICVDAGQIDPATKQPKLVWDTFRRNYKANRNQPLAKRFGLASAALADGLLYCPTDDGELICFRAKDGELLWRQRYATEVRGSPLVADGKLYIFDVKARLVILTLNGEKAPDPDDTFEYRFPGKGGLLFETNGTPIAVNGRVYFTSGTDLYCLGLPDATPEPAEYPPLPAEAKSDGKAVAVRLFPADVSARPGEKVELKAVYMDANGREVKPPEGAKETWALPTPPVPKGAAAGPPALQGMIANGTLALAPLPSQQGYVDFEGGGLKARARVRVVPQIPYAQNFDTIPPGGTPGGWVNTNGRFLVKKLDDGTIVLSKLNTDSRPPLARANGYITGPDAADYTIQADLLGTRVRDRLPDMGLVNSRYTLVLAGPPDAATGKRSARIQSWDGRRRVDQGVDFDWQPDTWYTIKLTVEQKEKTALVRAKVWKRGEQEPDKWTVEFEDPNPNRSGAAAVFGYVTNVSPQDDGTSLPGSDIYYDNLTITPNKQ
jgi:outer membrane protein assembly factor BamB